MAKKSHEKKNARNRLAGLPELTPSAKHRPVDLEASVLRVMLAMKLRSKDPDVLADLENWHPPAAKCSCGWEGHILECGRRFIKGRGWKWLCPGRQVSDTIREVCNLVIPQAETIFDRGYIPSHLNPFRSQVHADYEMKVQTEIVHRTSSGASHEADDPAAPGGNTSTEVVDAATPEGSISDNIVPFQ